MSSYSRLSVLAALAAAAGIACSRQEAPRAPAARSATAQVTAGAAAARSGHVSVLLPTGQILVAGGRAGSSVLAQAELYDPASGKATAAGSLVTARADATATLLDDGRVLVAGGHAASGAPLASAELYDPAKKLFVATGDLAAPRAAHTATRLPSGAVVVAGGDGGSAALASVEVFDPAHGTWSAAPALLTARAHHTATLLGSGDVLFAGGDDAGTPTAAAETWTPGAGSAATPGSASTDVGPMAGPRARHTATLLATGDVLVAGGNDGAGELATFQLFHAGAFGATGALGAARQDASATLLPDGRVLVAGGSAAGAALGTYEIYAGGAFGGGGLLDAARSLHTATLLTSGRVVLIGGQAGGTALAAAESLEPLSGGWADTGAIAAGRYAATTTLLPDGKVLVAGGVDPWGGYLATTELYDPAADAWTPGPSLGGARAYHSATLLPSGLVLVVGGRTGAGAPLASAELYDPTANAWTSAGALNGARYGHTATLLGSGKVLVAGGQDTVGELATAEVYTPGAGFAPTAGGLQAPRAHHTATLLPSGQVLLVGGGDGTHPATKSAERYDPASDAFLGVAAPQDGRALHTATLLSTGEVLVVGGYDPVTGAVDTAERFDPVADAWAPAGTLPARGDHAAVQLPNGDVLVVGGRTNANGALFDVERWDGASGAFTQVPSLGNARRALGAVILPDATVLAVGGDVVQSGNGAERYDAYAATPAAFSPALTGPLPVRVPSASLDLHGGVLTGISEASSGDARSSAVNHPVVVLQRETGDGLAYAQVTKFSATGVTATLPALLPGWWWVRVYVAGVPTRAWPLRVLDPFLINPPSATCPPRGSIAFTASGASGSGYAWTLSTNGSGGEIDATSGVYQAGITGSTTDVVQVTDSSQNTAQAVVTVGPGVSITPPSALVPPRGSQTFTAQGGSGAGFTWSMVTSSSGGSIDAATGAYSAGPTGGVTDTIQVTDSLGNTATADVGVTTPLVIAPLTATVAPRGTATFTASGGSGVGLVWSVVTNGSGGASVVNGAYQAGPGSTSGNTTDVVRVQDSVGNTAEATVTVTPAITLAPATASVPPRGSATFTATGGSGTGYTWAVTTKASGATATVAGTSATQALYTAGATGSVRDVVTVTDDLGNTATVAVDVGPGITISPAKPGAKPGESITLTASGGSNAGFTWTMVSSASGGSVTAAGVYTGGSVRSAVDVVKVTDSLGNTAQTDVVVWPDWKPAGSGCGSTGTTSGSLGLVLLGLLLALRAGRRRPGFRKGAAALILSAAALSAQAQEATTSFVAQRFQPSGGAYDVLTVESAQTPGHLAKGAQLSLNYASRPLVLVAPTAKTVALLKYQTGVDLGLSVGLLDWAEVSLVASGVAGQARETNRFVPPALEPDIASAGLSDVRLVPKARLLDWRGVRVGVAAPVSFPTGAKDSYLGHGAMTFGPKALVEVDTFPWLRLLLNGGAVFRPDRKLVDLTIGNAWTYGVGAEVPLTKQVALLGSFAGEAGMSDGSRIARPMELLGAVRWRTQNGLSLTAGGGPGIGDGYGTPEYRVFVQLGFTTGDLSRAGYVAPPPPPQPEKQPEPAVEEKPVTPEVKPEPQPQPEAKPTPPAVETPDVPADELRIDTRIYFAFNRKDLKPEYYKELSELAKRIAADPRYRKIRIEGHADDLGAEEYNQWLSEQRARAVKAFLVKHGVDASKLEVIGYGNRRPAEQGKSKTHRAKNRRVEFGVE